MTCGTACAAAAAARGRLRVVLESDGGRTVLREQFSAPPLHVQRAIYCEESLEDMAHLYLMSSSGGILRGDRHRIEMVLGRDALAHVTTQGATRIYGMDGGRASQRTEITLGEGSYLEFIPDQIIPYAGSRFSQETVITAHKGASAVCSEVISPGRTAMGESFEYGSLFTRTRVVGGDGTPRFTDAAEMSPSAMRSFGVLGGSGAGTAATVGTAYVLCGAESAPELLHRILPRVSGLGGASITADGAGILVRLLGGDAADLTDCILDVTAVVRKHVTGAGFSGIRK